LCLFSFVDFEKGLIYMHSSTTASATTTRYGAMAIALHWVLAVAILGAFGFGLYLDDMPLSPVKIQLINWHKWAGVCILFASLFRVLWRLTHQPPSLPAAIRMAMPDWQHWAHRATHGLMYLLFIAVPLAGWAYSSAKGYPVVLFGLWPLPNLVEKSPELAALLKEAHRLGAFALIGLVLVHVMGVVKHQFIDRDGLLKRMSPWA
jgi:cytochrome b561